MLGSQSHFPMFAGKLVIHQQREPLQDCQPNDLRLGSRTRPHCADQSRGVEHDPHGKKISPATSIRLPPLRAFSGANPARIDAENGGQLGSRLARTCFEAAKQLLVRTTRRQLCGRIATETAPRHLRHAFRWLRRGSQNDLPHLQSRRSGSGSTTRVRASSLRQRSSRRQPPWIADSQREPSQDRIPPIAQKLVSRREMRPRRFRAGIANGRGQRRMEDEQPSSRPRAAEETPP
jgi:hypothetical protein